MDDGGFDELIHNPVRLRLCVLLMPVRSAHFSVLRDRLQVADSVLSKHLKSLVDAGYVTTRKVGRQSARPVTDVALTDEGRHALSAHLDALHRLAVQATAGDAATTREQGRGRGIGR